MGDVSQESATRNEAGRNEAGRKAGRKRASRDRKSKGGLARVAAGMTSIAGIATAMATITTSAAAVLGVVVHHQATQLQHAHAQVSAQARQISVLRSQKAARPAAAPTSTPSAGASAGAQLGTVAHYLSNLTPTVDYAEIQTGQQVIAAKPYVNSISFYCEGPNGDNPDEAYDVAGSSTFTAEVGIADDMQGATDVIATVTFSNESGQQVGKPVQVSLGHPVSAPVTVRKPGAARPAAGAGRGRVAVMKPPACSPEPPPGGHNDGWAASVRGSR